ncbi:MAG: ATP synthase F1 subunit epsilon [Aminipila sp.]
MAKSVLLEVITPSQLFYKDKVEMVMVKTLSGEEGFMANHAWACKLLDVGVLWIKEVGATEFKAAAISGGYIDIRDNFVIFTDAAEWADQIDVQRAKGKKERVEEWLSTHNKNNTDENEIMKAKISLIKQNTRMHLAETGPRRRR